MSLKEALEKDIAAIDAAADSVELVACTSEGRKIRTLLFAAEKQLRQASELITIQWERTK